MVGKPSGDLRTTSLTSLVPRQLMLQSCAVVTAGGGDKMAQKKSKKRRKRELEEKRSSPVARAALLRAIAAFLECGGFTRTLAALRSEAQLEIDDVSTTSVVDLEEVIYNYLESSKDAVVGTITGPEEQDAQNKAPRKEEEGIHHHSEEPISKKKKKKVNGRDDDFKTESEKTVCVNGLAECHLESKDQKRKKSKKSSKETIKSAGDENLLQMVEQKSENLMSLSKNASCLLDESNIRSKDKKKKKTKLAIDSPGVVVDQDGLKTSQEDKGKSKESDRKTDSQMPTIATESATSENPMGEGNSKSKDKKKRKHNLIVESSIGYGVEVQNGSKVDGGKEGKSISYVIEENAKGSNPSIENISSSPRTVNIDKKAKKRKRSATEETEVHLDNDVAVQESKQDLKGEKNKEETLKLDDSLLNSELHASVKNKKSEKLEDNSEKSADAPANKEPQDLKDANGTPATINGNLGSSEREGNGSMKLKKAELRHSGEPKTVNAFQRVKIDEVKFADERLQDNSYWAKDGAESGYGAKAQEVLGQVRGRDFRHEKTKKKRGTYRGGQIDFQTHSVKFEYSDDEE